MTPRPAALPVNVAGIPAALKAEPRWVAWRYDWQPHDGADTGRWTKIPYHPSGSRSKSNDPSTWVSFADAVAASGRFDGLGFMLGDGWAGLDLDAYDGKPWPRLDELQAYRETSPSGHGLKIFGRSPRIGGEINFGVHPPAFTTWTGPRFFTVTGQQSSGNPLADLSSFIDGYFRAPVPVQSGSREGYRLAAELSDDDLLLQMAGSDNGAKFIALWRGETAAYGGDHSRADQALCCLLAFYTNYDVDRIDRLFRLSDLMRDKWNSPSYRRSTLQKAVR